MNLINKTHVLIILLLGSCTTPSIVIPFPIDPDGVVEKATSKEVCNARRLLASKSHDIPKVTDREHWLLIDGILLEAYLVSDERQELSVEVDPLNSKHTSERHDIVTIISPTTKMGGVPIVVGEYYRILALRLHGKYYSWASLGSAPKSQTFTDSYECGP